MNLPLEHEVPLKAFTKQPHVQFLEPISSLYFLSQPAFQCKKTKDQIVQNGTKAKERGLIDVERIWLGIYYEKELLSLSFPKVEVRWIHDDLGYGVFAKKEIRPETFIGEYTGIIQPRLPKHQNRSQHCILYTCWPLGQKRYVIDAETKGNFTRLINHSETPNTMFLTVYWRGVPRILVLSSKKIAPEEQLSLHYGKTYWKQMQKRPL